MGRGRAKAKQTKVARDLKYRTYEPDLNALQRELSGGESEGNGNGNSQSRHDDTDELDDDAKPGDEYGDDYADERVNRN